MDIQRDPLIGRIPGGLALPSIALIVIACAAAIAVRRLLPATALTLLLQTAILAIALVRSAAMQVRRAQFRPRDYVAWASVLGASLVLGAQLLRDPEFWVTRVLPIGFYYWMFVMILGLTPKAGPSWCTSRAVLLASGLLIGPGYMIAASIIE